ncbi:DUF2286 domain-containing protein [Thermocladium modestius]|uniref:DUF2286 domain-containing protein n=1 Tax=Thermocladium modestius TaxID=62609 RepID=UPI00166DD309|nr:DUF2286 domain-containing protein [Thermocladium modestius]
MTTLSESIIIYVENNNVSKKETAKGDTASVVKDLAKKLIEEWDPNASDFIVLKDQYPIKLPLPLSKELMDKLSRFDIKRVGNEAEASLPVYEITYSNKWEEETFKAERLIVISPFINDEVTTQITDAVINALNEEGEGEEQEGEEDDEEDIE